MEVKFSELKKKKVVNVLDGKVLGFISDLTFDFPEGRIRSFTCRDKAGVFCKDEYILCPCDVNKIGDDAVLVCLKDHGCRKERCKRSVEEKYEEE